MTEDVRSRYSFRVLDLLERGAQVFRDFGFHVPKPVLADPEISRGHTFWWTDVENQTHKILQLQVMAASSEDVLGRPGELRFSFCLFDLAFGRVLGCRESEWINRDDEEAVEEAFASVESHLPVMLMGLRRLAEGLRT
jgi:hypothetical protein